jgi:hypothetical protein
MGGTCSTHWRIENSCTILVGKREGKRPFRTSRRVWEDNIKINLKETVCEGVDSVRLAQERGHWRVLVNTVMNLRVP